MKTFRRILLILLVVVGILILFIPLSILVDSLLGRNRVEALTNTTIPAINNTPDVLAYVAKPQGDGPFPQ
jgi:hypothetical protein